MAIIKAVSSRASIGRAITYVTKDEKTEDKLISGIDCDPHTGIEQMKTTKAVWDKEDGREYYHFVQSFKPNEVTPEQAHEIANQLCAERFKGYEVVLATHNDRDHIHTHFIVNSVNHEDGKKLHWSKHDLQEMKDMSDRVCEKHGLSITEKGEEITTNKIGKFKALEKGMNKTDEYKSYLYDCYKAVNATKETATSREDFIKIMREKGFETNWSDSRKHITFSDMVGIIIRNTNLEKTFKEPFGKEDLEHGFERANEAEFIRARAADNINRGLKADTGIDRPIGGSQTDDSDLDIDKLNATIGKAKTEISRDDGDRANRNADSQSRQRGQDRSEKPRTIEKSGRSTDREH